MLITEHTEWLVSLRDTWELNMKLSQLKVPNSDTMLRTCFHFHFRVMHLILYHGNIPTFFHHRKIFLLKIDFEQPQVLHVKG